VPEIGIRLAPGATGAHVVGIVTRSVLAIATAGLGLGILSFALLRYVAGLLDSQASPNWASVGGAALLAVVGALAAGLVPGYRAAHVDPILALRRE
jgi:putative ABC transport system permease protein